MKKPVRSTSENNVHGEKLRDVRNDAINKLESAFIFIVVFLTFWISARLILIRLEFSIWDSGVAALIAVTLTYIFRIEAERPFAGMPVARLGVALCVPAIFVFAIFWSGYTLPAHDPIAVPTLANTIISGYFPSDVYPPGSSAHAYPPGQPLLLSALHPLFDSIERIFVLKIVMLITVALLPAAWAWLHYRLFELIIPSLYIFIFSYLIHFGIERTLLFSIPFAGKNSVIFGIFLTPFIIFYCIRISIFYYSWIIGGLAIFGLTLINYSLLHLVTAFLGSYAILGLLLGKLSWRQVVRIAAMGAVAATLMLVFLQEALFDPRAGTFTLNISGFLDIVKVFFAKTSFMVIYADSDFGLLGFPFRGLVLIAATVLSIYVATKIKLPSLLHAATTYAGAIIIAMMFGFSVIPAGLKIDFMRWFLWALQAQLLLGAASACWFLLRGKDKKIRYAVASFACVLALTLVILDARVFSAVNTAQAIDRNGLMAVASVMNSETAACGVIADSSSIPDALVTVQKFKLLDYVEAVTGCRYLNGSWVQPGVEEGRTENGFPSARALQSLPQHTDVFLIASEPRMAEYRAILSAQGLNGDWKGVGSISGFPVWKYETK